MLSIVVGSSIIRCTDRQRFMSVWSGGRCILTISTTWSDLPYKSSQLGWLQSFLVTPPTLLVLRGQVYYKKAVSVMAKGGIYCDESRLVPIRDSLSSCEGWMGVGRRAIIKRLVYSSILHDSRGSTDVDPDEEKV